MTTRAESDLSPLMPPVDSAEFNTMLRDLSVDYAPRRFALCEVRADEPDGWVFGWGVEFNDRTAVFLWGGRRGGVFRSTEAAFIAWSQLRNLRLVWIDPESDDEPDPDSESDPEERSISVSRDAAEWRRADRDARAV